MKAKTKRVLHITGPMNRAGTETMLMNIYRNIDREKVQFDFLLTFQGKSDYEEEILEMGGKILVLQFSAFISPGTRMGSILLKGLSDIF